MTPLTPMPGALEFRTSAFEPLSRDRNHAHAEEGRNAPVSRSLMYKTLSVIVCTRNRARQLSPCLMSVVAAIEFALTQGFEAELIVVDNGSTDGTSVLAAELLAASGVEHRVYFEPRPGLSRARNAGLHHARGQIIAFTDDDCHMSQDYLVRALALHQQDLAPVLRGGRVELGDESDLGFTVIRDTETRRYDPRVLDRQLGGFILGCNMCAPKSLFDAIGGFDERFGVGAALKAAEDTDYMYRAHIAGYAIEYAPELLVHHFHGRREIADVQKVIDYYNEGEGAIYAKYFLSPNLFAAQLRWDLRDTAKEAVLFWRKTDGVFGVSKARKLRHTAKGFARFILVLLLTGLPI